MYTLYIIFKYILYGCYINLDIKNHLNKGQIFVCFYIYNTIIGILKYLSLKFRHNMSIKQ